MNNVYTNGEYLETTKTWHTEDSSWKANQIHQMCASNSLQPQTVAEVGCGAGRILSGLASLPYFQSSRFYGYDISRQAINLAKEVESARVQFFCQNIFLQQKNSCFNPPDLLLVIDVFEHVPDYMGFLELCCNSAEYKIYHIPLEINIRSILINMFKVYRHDVGHLHYFSAETALTVLKDTGHKIIDQCYTRGALELYGICPISRLALVNVPRWLFGIFNTGFSQKLFGGYSLLVLAK